MTAATLALTQQRANRRLAIKLAVVAALMVGFAYGMVPFYNVFCEALGVDRARPELADTHAAAMRVEFDSNVAAGLPARLTALEPVTAGRAGGLIKAKFRLENLSDAPLGIRAVPSYAPERAGRFLQKLECFCFNALTLAPRETREVTVVLLVEADMPPELGAVTLSYMLYPLEENPHGEGKA
ncbi:cytochrome c oxidase assembly protein [Chitiniphilus shinanonensis]|uniref:Cytochrome c oxidase assembly protein CtaG n=1 Tax=Chitiniphilus shinanonensis TaxID=553088 RepID=A0ABQ6BWV4_9NEIS|nr:cytochrome c oxidase assembly protein [Chitiniphilus shinanonensis]GLS05660.1 cytochrome c oxidase assembly protein [Chitiniphilus shinanonensis]